MSFIETLEALRALKERKGMEERKREAEEKRLEEKKREELEMLKKVAEEKFSPAFNLTNEVYLGGRGKVSVGSYSHRANPIACVRIDWDRYHDNSRNQEGGKRLEVTLSHGLDAKLQGFGGSPKIEFNLEDEDWKAKFEQGICSILELGESVCEWTRPLSMSGGVS